MADDNYLNGPAATSGDQPLGTAGDFAKTFGEGALNVGSNLAAGARYFYELGGSEHGADIAQGFQKIFGAGAGAIGDTINPETKKLAASAITSSEFWEHPVLATALKTTGMAPAVVALAIPGGLVADAVGATMVASAGGGAINAGAGLDEFYRKLDGMSDEELQAQSPKYKAMREMFDEKSSRARFNKEAQGWGPALNAVIGAAAAAAGPAGTAARSLAGGTKSAVMGATERGTLARAGLAAAEGAAGNAVQAGVADATSQNAEIEAGMQQEFDRARVANAALEGGALGGLMGGAVGLVVGGGAHGAVPEAPKPEKAPKAAVAEVSSDAASPQQQTGRASAAPGKPVATEDLGNPQSAPVRSSRDGAKPNANAKTKPPVEEPTPAPIVPDQAVVAAVAANDTGQQAVATPNEVAALTKGSPNETIDKLNEGEAKQAAAKQAAPLDTGANTPEQPATLAAQIAQIGTGDRKAVMFPNGTVVPASAMRPGLKSAKTSRGRFIYDPKLTNAGEIQKLSRLGRENELLGLGPVSKPEAVARANAGEAPVAITERAPDGTEVKAAAGTTGTVPEQVASLEAQKSPGNVVAVETPENVLQRRTGEPPKRVGRILPNLTQTAETVPLSDFNKNKVTEKKEPQGKHYSEKETAAKDAKLAAAKTITDKHVPDPREDNYLRDPEARNAVIRRAQAMLADADAAGVKVQAQLKKSVKGDSASDHPSMQILRAAKDLSKVAAKRQAGREITEAAGKFAQAERLIRGGHSDEVLAQRREEGDAAMRRAPKGEEVAAATDVTPESELAKKEGAEVVSKEEANVTSEGKQDAEKNAVKTSVASSAKGDVRGISAPTEERVIKNKSGHEEKVEVAKAANAGRVYTPEERAVIAARYASGPKKNTGEALRVERNPTEAQKKAGNYKKGHRRVEGLDFTIENPRGAMRRGVDEHGEPWEVRMPADYGYLRGTEGADGDHVDAYDLRTGKRHFVVDQLDHKTGNFDEHKVLLRANDDEHAAATYRAAFSDGKGNDRLGYMHEVDAVQLKDWLKTGDTSVPHAEHVLGHDETYAPPDGETVSDHLRTPNGDLVKAVRSDFLSNELKRFDLRGLHDVGGIMGKFILSRLQKLADDSETVIHYVTPEDMARLYPPSKPGGATPHGYHTIAKDGVSHIVVDNTLKANGVEHGSLAHVVLHEAVHSITSREIDSSSAAKSTIRRMMRSTAEWLEDPSRADFIEELYGRETRYAFTNEKEFIAEAFSNKHFQEVLAQIPLNDPVMQEYLGLNRRSMTMWDMFRGFVKKAVQKITGEIPQFDSMLDAIMKVGEHLETRHRQEFIEPRRNYPGGNTTATAHAAVEGEAFRMVKDAQDSVKRFLQRDENNTSESAPKVLKLRTFDNIAQIADHYFGENNPVRKIHETIERMRVTGEKIFQRSEPLVKRLATVRAADPGQFSEFSSLLHDATVANVHPDVHLSDAKNAHLGKSKTVGDAVWSKSQHPELAKRYSELSPELKELWHDVVKHYTDTQNQMSLGIINNQILKLMGIEDSALAQRIHEGTLTDADKTALGGNLDVIEKAGELSKIDGPYVPLMRRGDHVVKADYKISQPAGTKLISPNEFEFKSDKDATAYAKASKLRTTIKKVWVDEKTGELTQTDPATGKVHRMSAEDLDAVPRYRAEVQNRHVEFVQGKRAAEARATELAKDGSLDVHKVVPRAYEASGRQAAELSTALGNLAKKLEKSDAYKQATPTQQATMRAAIGEASLASHGSTRVSSRALPRRGVKGFSEDLVQNTVDYGASSSRYLAKLEHGADLEAALKDMKGTLDRDHSKTGQYARTAISNEVLSRVNGDNGFQQGGKLAPIVKRALSISFIDKLGSPAYSVINAMQPGMVTMPYLSGRHGVGRSFMAMSKAYSDINSLKIVKEGLKETGRRIAGKRAPEDFLTSIKKNLSPDERRMIDDHVSVGTLDPSAGMEIAELTRDTSGIGGKVDAGLGYLEGVTREMPRAIESINRAVTAIAAYRLERSRGATHEKALEYSKDAVNSTQFNYSPTNSPALFNHPLLKVALQFKKYGQGMYQLIGSQIAHVIRNQEPGERARAVKTLITLAATHAAIAGALGLPTEPFKYLLMATHAAGLTKYTWGDIENKVRQGAASVLGKTGGEVFSKGLPHLINLDLSRAGLDSVTSFGEPKSNKDTDVKSWLFDSLAGPVVSLGGDWIKGVNQIANGQFEKAAENLIPLKAASDSLRAYRQFTEGKKSAAGRQTMTPYSGTEAGMRVLGFGSAREEEIGAANSTFYRNSARQKEERSALVNDWAAAKPSGKAAAWAAIQKWNQQQPKDVKIAPKELTDKSKRDATANSSAVHGVNANKRDKRFLDEGAVYNTR